MFNYSPALWAWAQQAASIQPEDRCVNEGALRSDGTYCREVAEPNGWCLRCWSEVAP